MFNESKSLIKYWQQTDTIFKNLFIHLQLNILNTDILNTMEKYDCLSDL